MGALANTVLGSEHSSQPGLFPWFALRIRSRFEKTSATILRSKGFEEFSPSYRSKRTWSDRVKELDLPLFPGYMFCRFNPLDRFPILSTPGVVAIVGIGKIPRPVEDHEIEQVQAILESGIPAQPWPFLEIGQKVRISEGSLTGLEGFLVNFKNSFRLVVSVTLLQRSVAVEIDRECIEPLPQKAK
ncbi:MAG: NusG-like protein [Acidobacteriota bacterium]|nr:NusG-like protein [Acidobacteriota bacterium]